MLAESSPKAPSLTPNARRDEKKETRNPPAPPSAPQHDSTAEAGAGGETSTLMPRIATGLFRMRMLAGKTLPLYGRAINTSVGHDTGPGTTITAPRQLTTRALPLPPSFPYRRTVSTLSGGVAQCQAAIRQEEVLPLAPRPHQALQLRLRSGRTVAGEGLPAFHAL